MKIFRAEGQEPQIYENYQLDKWGRLIGGRLQNGYDRIAFHGDIILDLKIQDSFAEDFR